MAPEILYKDPDEVRIFSCDFTAKLAAGAILNSVAAVTAAPAGLTIASESVTAGGLKISATFSSGAAGTDHLVTWRGVASNGETLEESGVLRVRNTTTD